MKTEVIYHVGLYLTERVHFGPYGFTSYVDCYTKAEDFAAAEKLAKLYFEKKYKVGVTRLNTSRARQQDIKDYAFPEQIISIQTPLIQSLLF